LIETIKTVRKSIDNILVALTSDDVKTVTAAMTYYRDLVDAFYRLNKDRMSPQQYEASLKDMGYFTKMVEAAEEYHHEGRKGC
jgi:hypothetical protein